MKKLLLLILMGGLAASVQSAPTDFTHTYNFGQEGIIWDAKSHSWAEQLIGLSPTTNWSHEVSADVGANQLICADLTITGQGIDNILCDWDGDGPNESTDLVKVRINGTLIGSLAGNVTTFSLPLDMVAESNVYSATIDFVYDRGTTDKFWPVDLVRLCSSTLTVCSDVPSPTPAVVPAPGAMVLGSIGVMFVGWLKNRRTI